MEIGKKTLFIMALALVLVAIAPVAAYMIFEETIPQQIQSGITLQVHPGVEMGLGIYWDAGCTQNVTTIDFGEMVHPNTLTTLGKYMWIRNEGNVSHTVYWNSTLQEINITDSWVKDPGMFESPLNGTVINVGETLATSYRIQIQPYATVGTYNWTVTVWAEYKY